MKSSEKKEGFLNRHLDGLPKETINIIILNDNIELLCEWIPCIKNNGYLGTSTVIKGKYKGIGFHAWEQNELEFIYYKLA